MKPSNLNKITTILLVTLLFGTAVNANQDKKEEVPGWCLENYKKLDIAWKKTKTVQEIRNVEYQIYRLGSDCPSLVKKGWYPSELEPKGTDIGVLLWHATNHLISLPDFKDDKKNDKMHKPYGPLWTP